MATLIHHNFCPACGSSVIQSALSAVDKTVTHETFSIFHCTDCTLRFTQDIPDFSSIGKYYQSNDYISHSDSKEGIINRLYHYVRNFTLVQKFKLILHVTGIGTGNLLDIGAGTGAFANTMKQKGWRVTGLEPDFTARTQAENIYGLTLDTPELIDTLTNHSFDVITLWHVLEHVHDLNGYWNHFNRLLHNNGKLVIAVPNYTSSDAQFYKANWAAYDVPRHLYHFSPASMVKLAAKYGFKLKKIAPMWFDSFYVSMLSSAFKKNRTNLVSAFCIGLWSNVITLFNAKKCSSIIYILERNKDKN